MVTAPKLIYFFVMINAVFFFLFFLFASAEKGYLLMHLSGDLFITFLTSLALFLPIVLR